MWDPAAEVHRLDYFKGLRPDQFPYKSNLENLMKCQEGKLKCKVIVLT